jgi:GMP synthase-like glutamine amidotransferase
MKLRIAILDLYEGQPNQGMRCIRQLIREWGEFHSIDIMFDEFEVRQHKQLPDLSYDVYLSTGGPGSPLDSIGSDWETLYFNWLEQVNEWNNDPENQRKKFIFLICHSFQIVCRHYHIGTVSRRKSTAFGVFPVHVTAEGQADAVFSGLKDPFYVVDSRDYQVTTPDFDTILRLGAQLLCIEKYRPHVMLEQAIMGVRFNPYMMGTQFHPEADAIGMSMHLQTEERKKLVIQDHGEEKWRSMVEQLNDPDKIMWTYAHVIPNFLSIAWQQLRNAVEAQKERISN